MFLYKTWTFSKTSLRKLEKLQGKGFVFSSLLEFHRTALRVANRQIPRGLAEPHPAFSRETVCS